MGSMTGAQVTLLIRMAMGGTQVITIPKHDAPEQQRPTGDGRNGKSDTGKPHPPRWAQIYMLLILLALIVWIILDVLHGGPPWYRHW
jgi:hypothetical protein